MPNDQIAIIRQQSSEIGGEGILLKIQSVVLLISENEVVVLDIESRSGVSGAKDRSTTLACELACEDIVLHTLDHQQHIALNTLFLLKGHISPTQGVDIFLDALSEGVEHLLVAARNLVRIDGDGTLELLSV
jgi:hypothetical protein